MLKNSLSSGAATGTLAHISTLTETRQETMGNITVEIIREGKVLNRKNICKKLLARLEVASSVSEEEHLQSLIVLLLDRQ